MQRGFRYLTGRISLAIVMLVIIGAGIFSIALVARAQHPTDADQLVQLKGQTVPLLGRASFVGAASPQQQLALSIGLHWRNQQELTSLLAELYNPHSSLYHHFLTPQQFTTEFAPTADQQRQVVDYLHSQGLSVTHIASNGLLIDATGTVAQAESAFHVTINNYQVGTRHFYANASAPSLPASISSLITSIGGLDNSTTLHPLSQLSVTAAHIPHRSGNKGKVQAAAGGYGPSDLLGAYDGATLQQAGITGSGQTVAVFELDGYQQSDITHYLQSNNLGNPSITNVLVDGYNGAAGAGAIEVELDIEVVAAMAPGAAQIVYEGPNTTQGVNDTYNQIVTDNKAQVMTTSWGECEAQSGTSELQTLDNIFKQGAAQGIAFFAASGDSGAYDCNDNTLAVDSPADDPYVTGVGGTTLQINNGTYGSETVWSNPSDTQRSPNGAGGGGGISNTFAEPTWQTGPGVKNQYSNGNREVPDVSADADPNTGYAIYCTVSAAGCPSTGNVVVGGTSAAAPLWAGSTAMINQYLQQQGKSRVGFFDPQLYQLASTQQQYAPFHDITTGNNLYYPATAGYDEASGLGTPDIYNIARDLAGGSTPPPTPTPTNTPTPTPVPTSTPTPTPVPTGTPTPPGSGSLIQNGGFENGTAPWRESSSGGYELIDTTNPHTGNYSAYLCGYSSCQDSIAQSFTVPSGASSLSITYWWYAETYSFSSSCDDSLIVQVLDSNGKSIDQLQKVCNTSASANWQQATFDAASLLSKYAGQTVTLVFTGTTSSGFATTSFFIDDVAVNAA
jgi:subtilase family serine protease